MAASLAYAFAAAWIAARKSRIGERARSYSHRGPPGEGAVLISRSDEYGEYLHPNALGNGYYSILNGDPIT
jgi:hypothetical protein